MKTYLLALLTVAALALPAFAAKPNFDYASSPTAVPADTATHGDEISSQLAELSDRVDRIERQVEAMRSTTHSMLSELMSEQRHQVAPPQPARAAEPTQATAPAVTYAAPASYVRDSGPVVQAWVEPAPSNWQQYRNAQGQLPSTSVGGQTITASPAYMYTDAYGRTVHDYPVSISAAPPVNVPVVNAGWQQAAMYQPRRTYSYVGGACYGGRCYGGACYGGACVSCR